MLIRLYRAQARPWHMPYRSYPAFCALHLSRSPSADPPPRSLSALPENLLSKSSTTSSLCCGTLSTQRRVLRGSALVVSWAVSARRSKRGLWEKVVIFSWLRRGGYGISSKRFVMLRENDALICV